MKNIILIMLASIVISQYAEAKMYKCTDVSGKLSFQDKPCAGEAIQKEVVATRQFSDSISKKAKEREESSIIGKRAFTVGGEVACNSAEIYRKYHDAIDSKSGHP